MLASAKAAEADQYKLAQLLKMDEIQAKRLWQTCDAVCFDVDSTVCSDEGIDKLAAFCGVGEEVAAWY